MPLRIALAQINSRVGDLVGNRTRVLAAVARAAEQDAHVVILPEMVLTGYPIEDLALRGSFQRAAYHSAEWLAQELQRLGHGEMMVVAGTLGTAPDGRPTNTAVALHRGRIEGRYDKHHLPNYGVFDEYRLFSPGHDSMVLEVDGHRLGIAICEDIWQADGSVTRLAGQGIEALCVLNGSPYELGKLHLRRDAARSRAAELQVPVVYVNAIGAQDDLVFDGGSFVVDTDGTILADHPQFVEDVNVWEVGSAGVIYPGLEEAEEIYRACVLGLRDYVQKNDFSRVALGLSGGIDSALVASIAADAVGGENVVGVSMPSVYSSEHSKDDAADLAERIGADYRVQPIAPMVQAYQSQMNLVGLAEENLQARVRGVIMMALSNSENLLVLATSNKSELATGYSTIYGDAVGGFAPIKDVVKTRVWEISTWRNRYARARGETPPIPENSIIKPPSAELRPDQTDQDSLPDYAVLDAVLDDYVEHGLGRAELTERGHDAQAIDLVLRLTDRAEWKRRQYPPGPKVTSLAFGRDRRLPITNAWREPLDEGNSR